MLLDRVDERDRIDRLLDEVRAGTSRALLVRGEAGIGKTALVRYAAERATAFRVARVGSVEAEMELPFAGLHQLCTGMDDELERLPAHQRDALRVALGVASGDPPDQFLIGLAVLNLLAAVAEQRPLCCLVEDVQWLDVASAQVLGFVARRLRAESVALVVTVRDPGTRRDFAGVPELRLEGLPGSSARALLTSTVTGRLDGDVCDRIVAETGGNPLALLELPARMTAAELAGGFALAAGHGVPSRIEQHYRRRIEELPEQTRTLMLVAAADPSADAALVWRAAPGLGIHPSALVPAQQAELLQVGARVRFRHPLVRSAAYQLAGREQRRRVHQELALVSDPDRDADRRAWHRALAAPDVDDRVADELERSAGRAQARGGLAAAAAFLQRAAALTSDPGRRAHRSLAAAQASLRAGDFDTTLSLLTSVEAGHLGELDSALAQLLRAQVTYARDRGGEASQLLLDAAGRLEPLDARLARQTYLEAWGAALFAGDLARSGSLLDVSRAASAAAPAPGPALPSDLLLEGLSLLFTDGLAEAAPLLHRAVSAFAGAEVSTDELLRWGWLATRAASLLWDSRLLHQHRPAGGAGRPRVRCARGPRGGRQRPRPGHRLRRRPRRRRAPRRRGRGRPGRHGHADRPARRAGRSLPSAVGRPTRCRSSTPC